MVDVGERIKKARKAAGLTQRELAEKIHMSQSYIADMERSRHNPSLSALQLIANALSLDISEFVGSSSIIQETGMSNDEIHLVMSFRDLADNDKTTVKNLVNSLRLLNRQNKSVKSTPLMNYDTSKMKVNAAGLG